MSNVQVVVTGMGMQRLQPLTVGPLSQVPGAREAFEPIAKLGRRGLRFKDLATKLAYCAVTEAVADSGLNSGPASETWGASCGSVVTSAFASVGTLRRSFERMVAEGYRGLSPMELPNASPNMLAASIAIRFGLLGPSLMVTQFEGAGIEALRVACGCIRAGRVERVVVVGCECDEPGVTELVADGALSSGGPLRSGAFALVLESQTVATARGAKPYAVITGGQRDSSGESLSDFATSAAVSPASWFRSSHVPCEGLGSGRSIAGISFSQEGPALALAAALRVRETGHPALVSCSSGGADVVHSMVFGQIAESQNADAGSNGCA